MSTADRQRPGARSASASELTLQRVRSVLSAADRRARERLAAADKEAEAALVAARAEAAAIISGARRQADSPTVPRRKARRPPFEQDDLYSARLLALPLIAAGSSREEIKDELVRQLGPDLMDAALEYVMCTVVGTGN